MIQTMLIVTANLQEPMTRLVYPHKVDTTQMGTTEGRGTAAQTGYMPRKADLTEPKRLGLTGQSSGKMKPKEPRLKLGPRTDPAETSPDLGPRQEPVKEKPRGAKRAELATSREAAPAR